MPARDSLTARTSAPQRTARRGPATHDWRWELRHAVTTVEELAQHLQLSPDELRGARRAEREGLRIGITPYYLALCDRRDARCPVRLQCVPRAAESIDAPGDLADPLGEEVHEVAPRLICRYPDRALLLTTDTCAVYCRFCTRSRWVGGGGGAASVESLAPALAWLSAHPAIRDVVVSGGDPLTLSTDRIVRLVASLRRIGSVETIRLATRVPVTLPCRVTGELVRALRPYHPVWVMTHFNHPKELTREAERACTRLVDGGFPVNNQTVLLRGVNDDARTLMELFRTLVRWRVRPYYLLQADPVSGTSHLRTALGTAIGLVEQLQGQLSGIALPRLVVDAPGGLGKVPVGPDWVVRRGDGSTTLRTPRGVLVDYVDPTP